MEITSDTSKVWSRFERKRKDGSTVKIRFQKLTLERLKEAIDFNIKYILRDEAIHIATGVYKNPEATREYRNLIDKMFELDPPHVTICCVDDGTELGGELAGMAKMSLVEKSSNMSEYSKMIEMNTKEMENLMKAALVLDEPEELTDKFSCHFNGKGIIIHPDYRGMGIATEFIRLRGLICKEQNVPMASALMTARGSQLAAEKNGWKVYEIVDPQDLSAKTGIEFEDTAPFKRMYISLVNNSVINFHEQS